MPQSDVQREVKAKMAKAIEAVQHEMSLIRTGRASVAILDVVRIDYYGSTVPLSQAATVTAPEPQMLMVQPWDRNMLQDIEKAIQASDLGLTPTNDGQVIRLAIPRLDEERRKELARIVRKKAEEGRVSIRNARREANDALKKLEKASEIAEDVRYRVEKEIQELTDAKVAEVDKILESKEADIMAV